MIVPLAASRQGRAYNFWRTPVRRPCHSETDGSRILGRPVGHVGELDR
jgi:hypothetical protein